jgi:hypothetical protein
LPETAWLHKPTWQAAARKSRAIRDWRIIVNRESMAADSPDDDREGV